MRLLKYILGAPRKTKKALFLFHDAGLIFICFWLAIGLRVGVLDEWGNESNWLLVTIIIVFSLAGFSYLGLYRRVIRYAGMKLIRQVFVGSLVSVLIMLFSAFLLHSWLPRSVPFGYFLLLSALLIGSRFTIKGVLQEEQKNRKRPILIYGAGAAGRMFYATAMKAGELLPIAFIDDNINLQKQSIHNLSIYSPEQLSELVEQFGIEIIVLAIPNATHTQRQAVLDKLSTVSCQVLTIPNLRSLNLLGEAVGIGVLKKVSVIDLLGRDAIEPIPQLMEKNIYQKVVMVTGAGGSIGSELCRHIIEQCPRVLVLFELSESALYEIIEELQVQIEKKKLELLLVPAIGSVTDYTLLVKLMKRYGVQTIYHAAAYKHVPLVEYNTIEGVRNNTFGTLRCAEAAIETGVQTFVLISTDKAVRPTNTMGATKRLAELVLQALAEQKHHKTLFCMVRFGNVLGSSGSVIPLFEKQISQGGPVTITHPEITRFFMTIPEAAQLVIQAGAMAEGGDVFVLDMGQPVKILALAKKMVYLKGLSVKNDGVHEGDIEFKFTGLRPGEKLYEELLVCNNAKGTEHPRIMQTKESMLLWSRLKEMLIQIECGCENFDAEIVRDLLLQAPIDFQPSDDICDVLYQ